MWSRPEIRRDMWRRASPWLGVAAFLGGFAWDALTLVRPDRFVDNALLGAYLVALCVVLVLEHRVTCDAERWPRLAPHAPWITYGVQFLFGGLFSAYVVFYLRSASSWPTLIFVVVLALALLANEFVHGMLQRSWLRLGLLWFVTYSYFLFVLPVLSGTFHFGWRLAAAAIAVLVGMLVGRAMFGAPAQRLVHLRRLGVLGGLSLGMGALDMVGVIPPVPLAVLELGAFHDVSPRRDDDGDRAYWLTYERPPWWRFDVDDDRVLRLRPQDAAHVFSALFAPTGMAVDIVHIWERYDEGAGQWNETDRIDVTSEGPARGGRTQGFRTWSEKRHVPAGAWRVRVVDGGDRELGRTYIDIVHIPDQTLDLVERPWH